jgi:transposase-like protein
MVNYECRLCNFSTQRKTELERHKITKKHILCVESNKCVDEGIVINKSKIKKTNIIEKKHEDVKFICSECGENFTLKTNMYRHIRKYHKKQKDIDVNKLKEENEELKKLLEIKKKNSRKNNIPKSVKISTWNENFGKHCGEHECYIGCGKLIYQGDFECGHIIAESKGGLTRVDNLKPICSQCNKSMQTQNLEEYKKIYFKKKKQNIVMNNNSDTESDIESENESDIYFYSN